MNTQAQSLVAEALSSFATSNATSTQTYHGVVSHYCGSRTTDYWPWVTTRDVYHYTFDSDKEAQLKAIRAILKLKIEDEDKVEAITAILK